MEEETVRQRNIYLDCRSQRSTGLDSIPALYLILLPFSWHDEQKYWLTKSSPECVCVSAYMQGCLRACAMCDVRTRPLPLELAGGRVEQRYASVCRWECVWKLPARWSVKPPSSCAADGRICFKVSFYQQKLRLISQVRTQREKETGGQRDFQTDRKPPLFLSAKNGGLTSYPRWAGKKCLPPAAQYVGMCDCSMKIINQKREGLKSRYALFSYKEMSAMLLWAHK